MALTRSNHSIHKRYAVTKTTTYTATLLDDIIYCDSSGGIFTITLPSAAGVTGKQLVFKKTDSSTNLVTLDGNGSETIDGMLTIGLGVQYDYVVIVSNGSNWLIIDQKRISIVSLRTANGYGSTNTKIRRFSTTVTNVGSSITYADSATLGATFTINEAGLYSIAYYELFSAATYFGVTLNTASPTTSFSSSLTATEYVLNHITTTAGQPWGSSAIIRLAVNDVIRAHGDATTTGSNGTFEAKFYISRVM